jgi:hypothetical protein
VYSTCLFCKRKLGVNGAIEHFPVGHRIAFDPARGRLWAVCTRCGRWNLAPLEERWEAVEEGERRFRAERVRYSTGQIGLARLRDGTELVRVGEAQRREFASWRYGARFLSRHRREMAWGIAGIALIGTKLLGVATLGVVGIGSAISIYQAALFARQFGSAAMPVTRLTSDAGATRLLRGKDIDEVSLVPSDRETGWSLVAGRGRAAVEVGGDAAIRSAGQLLARINAAGGDRKTVEAAVAELEGVDHPHLYFGRAVEQLRARRIAREIEWSRFHLVELPPAARLALEMAAHEEVERVALQGELRALEAAWREAEEIAAIADSLLLPARFDRFIARHRRRDSAPWPEP